MPVRPRLRHALSLGVVAALAGLSTPHQAHAQAAGTSRAIPNFARPGGSPDPALRVEYRRGEDAPPMLVRTGENSFDPLYRRQSDGSYAPARAAGYRIAMSSCPSMPSIRTDPRTRMIDLAAAEWAYFGLPVLDLSAEPSSIVPRVQLPGEVVDIVSARNNASTGARVMRHAPRLGLMEDDTAVRATIAGYWAATGSEEAMRVQSLVNYGWHEAGWAMPWSAAFISWLACEAGYTTDQFRRSGGHIDYVRASVRARDGQDGSHAFVAYDLGETVPAAGDLVCAARGGSDFASIADVRSGNSDSNALHCDLVVKTDAGNRRLFAIGGNVNQAVTLSIVATDRDGHVLNDRDIVGANRWFAVLKSRLGGHAAHDLDGTPTVQALYRDYARYAGSTRSPPPIPLQARGAAAPKPVEKPAEKTAEKTKP